MTYTEDLAGINFYDIEQALRDVVAEMPNFIYREFRAKQLGKPVKEYVSAFFNACNANEAIHCVYVDEDGEPSCLWGLVLHRLNISISSEEDNSIDTVLQNLGIKMTFQQLAWATEIQSLQDRKLWTFQTILDHADEMFPLRGVE